MPSEPADERPAVAVSDVPAEYPVNREADVVLRDGSTVRVRPVRPSDKEGLRRFFEGLSQESTWFRFFSAGTSTASQVALALGVDYRDRYGLVALHGADDEIVGNALYARTGEDRAEVAFAIAEELQSHGLGTIMLAHLAEAAGEIGIETLEAEVMPENHRMIEVFRASGLPVEVRARAGSVHVEMPSSLAEPAVERFEDRDRIGAVAAIDAFLRPASIAVIGASRRRGTVGGELFHNLISSGFGGPVYPVNADAEVVQSVQAYPTVLEVPGPVEMAVIAVPAEQVIDAACECEHKDVRSLLVISAGFAEAGAEGAKRQAELVRVCRRAGMRLIGPNCLGVLATSPEAPLNATFGPAFPDAGPVAFLSQSGALGLAIIDFSASLGLGLSSFASVGNKADISGNDLIQYWEQDPETSLILLYLESFGNPRKFSRIARRVGRAKPIVAVKSGRSAAGARASGSHTGALVAASDVTVDALFRQSGVIRTDNLAELFDVASLLANAPAPAGGRVAVLTNAGGPGIMCADACEASGLSVVGLTEGTRERLADFLPEAAALTNPVDMIATAPAEHYRRSLEILLDSGEVDAVIAIFIPPLLTRVEQVTEEIAAAAGAAGPKIPVLQVLMSAGAERGTPAAGHALPTYRFPEDAARALARVAHHAEWRSRDPGSIPDFEHLRGDAAAALIAEALARGGGWLRPDEVAALLDCYGVPLAAWRIADSPAAAGAAAGELGVPVALKAIAPGLVHKTEAGAVRLGLGQDAEVASAAEEMSAALRANGLEPEGFLVQSMVEGGVEMLVGVVGDPLFGPVIACGAGGTTAELTRDVAVRLSPLTGRDAAEMLRELATFPLLDGFRGAPKADVAALEEMLLRIGALVDAHPAIAEIDLNPVKVSAQGATVVDARVRVEVTKPPAPWPRAAS